MQALGVDALANDADKADPPSLATTLLKAAVEVAVAGGLGAVGKLVEVGVKARLAARAASAAKTSLGAEAIAKAIAASAQDIGKKLAAAKVQARNGDRKAFWLSQKEALIDTGRQQQHLFIDKKSALRAAPDGPAQAAALAATMNQLYDAARQAQYRASLDEWSNCLAMAKLGGDYRGDPFAVKALGDLSTTGVLGIEVGTGEPGAKPWVKRARIEGLNQRLRGEIASRPLGEIRITKNIKTELWGSDFDFALKPSGEIDWRFVSKTAGEWLEQRAKLGGTNGGIEGARLLVEHDLNDAMLLDLEG
jgi:hypothetical protein